ncbi:MAG: hypothetical protein E6J90_06505 [Deltaproteobacteria bacterium]|nr:MAG: hypothetical protein E6J91_03145 [Deltaproteobacteria bacterium]TMQ25175.1 MAG: hypothetical protein E6J90_06505 [Deltaproteobacteria bacterium]
MSDDDDLTLALRRAMASLDREVPAGYFDALPERTLARLDEPASGALASRGRSRRRTVAIAGLGVAAAASLVIFLTVRDRPASEAMRDRSVVAASPPAQDRAAAPEAPSIARNIAQDRAAGSAPALAEPEVPHKLATKHAKPASEGKLADEGRFKDDGAASRNEPGGGQASPPPAGPASGSGEASREDLAHAKGQKTPMPSTGDRTSLSAGDISRAMAAVVGKVRACFNGTPGLVELQLTVAPTGQIAAISVVGSFAGTPVGTCVQRAASSATFPAWTGAAQSFRHDYRLPR